MSAPTSSHGPTPPVVAGALPLRPSYPPRSEAPISPRASNVTVNVHRDPARTMLRAVVLVLALGAGAMLAPYWVAIVLAAWFAMLTRPWQRALSKRLGGREWGATVLLTGLALVVVVPFVLAGISLTSEGKTMLQEISRSQDAKQLLGAVIGSKAPDPTADLSALSLEQVNPQKVAGFVKEHGPEGVATLGKILGAMAEALVIAFVFIVSAHAFLVCGEKQVAWLADHAPIPRPAFHRFANAFRETGRGLVVGVGLTALAQGLVATVCYAALGVSQWAILGLLTCFAALIPSFGTAFVWVPVAAGLLVTGRPVAASVMAGVGVVVIASIDNVLRPLLSRFGKLDLSVVLLFVSIFGGLVVVGPSGLVLGPLLVRLAKEALLVAKDARLFEATRRSRDLA